MRRKRKPNVSVRTAAVKAGFRSGLEHQVWKNLKKRGVKAEYEPKDKKISYVKPETHHTYLPDIILSNGIIVEVKGRLTLEDRRKHLLIKEQNPELDVRFLFSCPNNKIRKGSQTTYAMWCNKNDIKWCEKVVPLSWIRE